MCVFLVGQSQLDRTKRVSKLEGDGFCLLFKKKCGLLAILKEKAVSAALLYISVIATHAQTNTHKYTTHTRHYYSTCYLVSA